MTKYRSVVAVFVVVVTRDRVRVFDDNNTQSNANSRSHCCALCVCVKVLCASVCVCSEYVTSRDFVINSKRLNQIDRAPYVLRYSDVCLNECCCVCCLPLRPDIVVVVVAQCASCSTPRSSSIHQHTQTENLTTIVRCPMFVRCCISL